MNGAYAIVLRIRKFLAEDKRRAAAIILAVFGLALILLSFGGAEDESSREERFDAEELEESIAELLSSMEGVGRCRVKISFASGELREYKSGNLVYSEPAKVSGVSVVCDGGGDSAVISAVSDALSALFGIGINRISVQKMK